MLTPMVFRRPVLSVESLLLAAVLFILATGNGPFWRAATDGRDWSQPSTWFFAIAMLVTVGAVYLVVTGLLATRHTVRPLLAVLLLVTAAAAYYMDRYSVYFDRAMVRNVLATDVKEATDLIGWGMALHVLLFGVVPAVLLWWPQLRRRTATRAVAVRLALLVGAPLAAVACLMPVFADVASFMRNHREVRHLITPGNLVASLSANAWGRARRPNAPRQVVGGDAVAGPAWQQRKRPALFVLVVGETARAQNFSLNGYARETNPGLAQRNVINFPDATACGTSTEVSLPCMFSSFGRARYDEDKIHTHEGLLQVLARAGIKVLWRDNQSGCKGVCDGVPTEQLDRASVAPLCNGGQCQDEILLHGMDRVVRDTQGNLFVVMHQMGSHGPAYFKRYPAAQDRFAPACKTEDLRLCSSQEIVNAYDNSLLYTDFFLSRVIDFLGAAQATHDTALLYVSDHGESLGEKGLYLHGMPYAIAPAEQKRVPFLLWLSPAFQRSFQIDEGCLRAQAQRPVSHDNLFASMLGVMDVQTRAYEPKLDVFAPCRPPRAPAASKP